MANICTELIVLPRFALVSDNAWVGRYLQYIYIYSVIAISLITFGTSVYNKKFI